MTGREVLQLLADGKPRLMREMAALLGAPAERVAGVTRCLRRRGYVTSGEGVYTVTPAGLAALERPGARTICKGQAAHSNNGLRCRAWRAMQMMTTFDADSLLDVVGTGAERDAAGNLRRYLRALHWAGMLARTRSGKYVLREAAKGPRAPSYNRAEQTVTDRNTGKIINIAGEKHA